jgi:hypothetical protein
MYKVEGQTDWVLEHWTSKPYVSFRRDAKAERLEELVILYSYSKYLISDSVNAPGTTPALEASDLGCWRYAGSASFEFTGQSIGAFTDVQQVSNVVLERQQAHPEIPYPAIGFKVVDGLWQRVYDVINTNIGCVGHATDSATLSSGNTSGGLAILTGATDGPSKRAYVDTNTVGRTLSVNIACPQGSFPSPRQTLPWLGLNQLTLYRDKSCLVQVGGALKGSDELPLGGSATYKFVWDLAPQWTQSCDPALTVRSL